jgi:hypothetical protein
LSVPKIMSASLGTVKLERRQALSDGESQGGIEAAKRFCADVATSSDTPKPRLWYCWRALIAFKDGIGNLTIIRAGALDDDPPRPRRLFDAAIVSCVLYPPQEVTLPLETLAPLLLLVELTKAASSDVASLKDLVKLLIGGALLTWPPPIAGRKGRS